MKLENCMTWTTDKGIAGTIFLLHVVRSGYHFLRWHPSKYEMFTQYWFIVGTPYATPAQHWTNIEWTSRVCWAEPAGVICYMREDNLYSVLYAWMASLIGHCHTISAQLKQAESQRLQPVYLPRSLPPSNIPCPSENHTQQPRSISKNKLCDGIIQYVSSRKRKHIAG